jgi:hypothetical protein
MLKCLLRQQGKATFLHPPGRHSARIGRPAQVLHHQQNLSISSGKMNLEPLNHSHCSCEWKGGKEEDLGEWLVRDGVHAQPAMLNRRGPFAFAHHLHPPPSYPPNVYPHPFVALPVL